MAAETNFANVSLLYLCEGDFRFDEFLFSAHNKSKRLVIGNGLLESMSIMNNIDVDVVIIDIDPDRLSVDTLNQQIIKMKLKKNGLSVIVITDPSDFADNITEADFIIGRNSNSDEIEKLIKYC
jgi:two-component SAPR family response regulator